MAIILILLLSIVIIVIGVTLLILNMYGNIINNHLPGDSCIDTSDCPTSLGCYNNQCLIPEHGSCFTNSKYCHPGSICVNGECLQLKPISSRTPDNSNEEVPSDSDEDHCNTDLGTAAYKEETSLVLDEMVTAPLVEIKPTSSLSPEDLERICLEASANTQIEDLSIKDYSISNFVGVFTYHGNAYYMVKETNELKSLKLKTGDMLTCEETTNSYEFIYNDMKLNLDGRAQILTHTPEGVSLELPEIYLSSEGNTYHGNFDIDVSTTYMEPYGRNLNAPLTDDVQ